jgi:ABC-type sulfate/molybdate transport systems ATPase subunit
MMDKLIVLDGGRVVQEGVPSHLFQRPAGEAAARATGEVNVVPVTIRGREVDSVIGAWTADPPPFQGGGVALARPDDFAVARAGEESDVILAVEEASFYGGAWHVRGILTGAIMLHVELPRDTAVHKGKLIALRYEPARFRLIAAPAV